jgi:PRC-barrel domain
VRWYVFTLSAALAASAALPSFAPADDDVRAQQPPAAGAEDTWSAMLPYQDAQLVLGKEVRGPAGEDMGRIIDVLVDQTAHVRAAVIDFGGFLGVGNRKVVVDWSALHFF